MNNIGRKIWAIAGGHIPLKSTGVEPEFVSQDQLCILNTYPQDAQVELTVYYASREPVGPYKLSVPARRTRHLRINDLIDPIPVPLDTDYACVLESDVPVVVQYLRRDTSQAENALLGLSSLSR